MFSIPAEVLQERGNVIFGVYAYKIIEDKLELRYSPHPTYFDVSIGSYNSEAEESQEITPTQFEQYMQALQNGLKDVQTSLDEINEATDDANELVKDITKKLENGEFKGEKGDKGDCNFATFEINLESGELEMNKTEDLLLYFDINSDGYMEVII